MKLGYSQKEIANKFNVKQSSISSIKTGRSWSNFSKSEIYSKGFKDGYEQALLEVKSNKNKEEIKDKP